MKKHIVLTGISVMLASCIFLPRPDRSVKPDQLNVFLLANGQPVFSFLSPPGGWEMWVNRNEVKRPGDRGAEGWKGTDNALLFPPGSGSVDYDWMVRDYIKYGFTAFMSDLSAHPGKTNDRYLLRSHLILNGQMDKALARMRRTFNSKNATLQRGVPTSIMVEAARVRGLHCTKLVQGDHLGPSPDPEESGKWAGMGSFRIKVSLDCPVISNKDGRVVDIAFRYELMIDDVPFRPSSVSMADVNPPLQLKRLEALIQHSFDTLTLYGFHQ